MTAVLPRVVQQADTSGLALFPPTAPPRVPSLLAEFAAVSPAAKDLSLQTARHLLYRQIAATDAAAGHPPPLDEAATFAAERLAARAWQLLREQRPSYVVQIEAALAAGDDDGALALADEAVANYPQAANAHHLRGHVLHHLTRHAEACLAWGEAVAREPAFLAHYVADALALHDTGGPMGPARDVHKLRFALRLAPGNERLQQVFFGSLLLHGQPGQAMAYARRVLGTTPGSSLAAGYAQTLVHMGRQQKGARALTYALTCAAARAHDADLAQLAHFYQARQYLRQQLQADAVPERHQAWAILAGPEWERPFAALLLAAAQRAADAGSSRRGDRSSSDASAERHLVQRLREALQLDPDAKQLLQAAAAAHTRLGDRPMAAYYRARMAEVAARNAARAASASSRTGGGFALASAARLGGHRLLASKTSWPQATVPLQPGAIWGAMAGFMACYAALWALLTMQESQGA